MKKTFMMLLAVLMVAVATVNTPMSALAADNSVQVREIEVADTNVVTPRSTTIFRESGYLSSSSNYNTYASNSTVYSNKTFTVIVAFKSTNGSGTATLKIGTAFSKTVACDGKSRAYQFTGSFADVPIMWEISNHPAGMSYVVEMYIP